MRTSIEHNRDVEKRERGKNVQIVLKFIRHGERDLEGSLTDYGRAVTRAKARGSGIEKSEYDAVKAIGSDAGPKGEAGMQRSLETAHLYAQEIAGDKAFVTRPEKVMSYQELVNTIPFDYDKIYQSNIPDDFDLLTDEEKSTTAKKAQKAVVSHLINMHTPEAEQYKKEAAGSLAYLIEHYCKMANRLDGNSRVLLPAGSHGGMMEHILEMALVRKGSGKIQRGFTDLEEIGGEFNPSEAFNVEISTDENGHLKPLKVEFDNPSRPQDEMYLDSDIVTELAENYEQLHSET